ncbi:hypothetical protein ACWH95_15155 [Microbacterium sp. NPDC055502]
MPLLIPEQNSVSEMWLETLRIVNAAGGRQVNVLSSTRNPTLEVPEIREVADRWLVRGARRHSVQPVSTVASTIFPAGRYRSPGIQWSADLPQEDKDLLDARADNLYARHIKSIPTLIQFDGNHLGTYFSRMVCWPGKIAGNVNQLRDRVMSLRGYHDRPVSSTNVHDIVVAGEADTPAYTEVRGLQVLQPTDHRSRGFPCLVHVDLTVHDNELHMLAVYRHQYLVTKAYGNILGLGRLQQFLCEQTGYSMGELAVQATLADAEHKPWSKTNVQRIIKEASEAVSAA